MSCNQEHELLKKFSNMDKSELIEMAMNPFMPFFGSGPIRDPKKRQSPWKVYGDEKLTCNTCDLINQKFKAQSICRSCSQFYQDLHTSKRNK